MNESARFQAFITHQDGCVVIKIRGEIDMAVIEALSAVVDEAVAASPHVVFDMADVTFLDSSGLRVLSSTVLKVRGNGSVTVSHAPTIVARVIEVAGMTDVLNVEPHSSPGEV